MVYAVEAEVEDVQDVEAHAVEVYLGKSYAPGFYGWLIPRLMEPQRWVWRLTRETPRTV